MNKRTFIKATAAAAIAAAVPGSVVAAVLPQIKVFRLNDYEWWAGPSLDACIADWKKWTGLDEEELDEPRELTAENMERLRFVDPDDETVKRSFTEELAERVKAGLEFPQPFAFTDY